MVTSTLREKLRTGGIAGHAGERALRFLDKVGGKASLVNRASASTKEERKRTRWVSGKYEGACEWLMLKVSKTCGAGAERARGKQQTMSSEA